MRIRLAPDAPRIVARVALLSVTLLGALVVPYAAGLRVLGPSRSMPRGVYWLNSAAPVPGHIVIMCLPKSLAEYGRARRYLLPRHWGPACPGETQPVGKLLAAAAGDEVVVAEDGLYVNGLRVAAWPELEREPRSDVELRKQYRLGAGEVWLHAPHPRSWDSRHFGPVTLPPNATVLEPVWTEDRAELSAIARRVKRARAGETGAEV
ncbi:MAG: S26 family signal peptidase [Candidatus Limnocylindria bacterium]